MPASEQRIQSNRANSAKSTGPRTAEGKARSRANALKHGMAGAGVVVPEQDRALFEAREEAWAEDLGATTDLDGYLASRAALASVRLDRCARQEAAALAEKRSQALARWWRERSDRASVGYHAGRMDEHAAESLHALQATSLGCQWLAEQWAALARSLVAVGGWDERAMFAALHYLGQSARPDIHSHSALADLWSAGLALRGLVGQPVGMLELERFFAITEFAPDPESRIAAAGAGLPDAEAAADMLRAYCEAEQARLEARRAGLWEEVDAPSQLRALDLAAFDDSPAAMLRLRYEAASRSDLHRAIEQVRKNHRARALVPEIETRNEANAPEALAPEVVEEPAVPTTTPAVAGPPRTRETGSAPTRPVRVALPCDPARNEANTPEGWEAEDAADLAELDALEAEMAELDAHVDSLCPA